MKTFYIDPFDLKEHKKASSLIPEMTEKEWDDFFNNVKEVGIRQPLDINKNKEVLDGRHRLRAAKKLKLEKIEVRQHDLTEEEEMEFVRDTAVERRNLTVAQKHKIVTDTEDLIKNIYEEGKGNQGKRNDLTLSSEDTKVKKHDTNTELGKLIGTSRATVIRLNKVKREAPEEYEKVVRGEKTAKGAYEELNSVKKNKGRIKNKRGDNDAKKEVTKQNEKGNLPINSQLFRFKSGEVTKEEEEKLLLQSEHETLKSYVEQISMLFESIDDIRKVLEHEKDFYVNNISLLERFINSIKEME